MQILKSVFLSLASVLFFSVLSAQGATITFLWDANTEPDLAGYKLYQGTKTGDYAAATPVELGNVTTHKLEDIADGQHFFVVTAVDADGNESGFSNEVTVTIDTIGPGAPQNFKITIMSKSVSVEVE
jgi:fibronectin type 3 domain-containing protein